MLPVNRSGFFTVLLALACGSSTIQTIKQAALNIGASNLAATLCAAGHGFDEKIGEADAALRWCSDPEHLKPWEEEARRVLALVEEQRRGGTPPAPSASATFEPTILPPDTSTTPASSSSVPTPLP